MPSHIALRGLPIENLKRKPFRTGALLAVVTILALTFFGGTMLTMNLNTGMTSMEKRLGADLMVVPQNTVQKAEALLTNGNPSTFYFTKDIADEVMQDDGIADGDLLVVDKSLEAYDGCVAVCFLDGEFTLKRLRMGQGKIVLVPANKRYKPIEIGQESDFTVWGVVTYAIKKV